ncbi:MAG: CvpA family protein [Clostridia bacterium]|nr:CvpA family protein [Clostridia bacterium]
MNWLDLGIVLFVAIFIIIGVKKGFMSSVISNFSFSLNLILSFFLHKPIQSLYMKWFGGNIATSYASGLIETSSNFGANLISIPSGELKGFVKATLDAGEIKGIPRIFYNLFLNNKSLYPKLHDSGLESRTLADILGDTRATFLTTIIAFVTAFILLYLIILLFNLLVKKLRENGFVKVVDNSLGALYGLFQAFISLVIICLILNLMSPFDFMQSVETYINGSLIGRFIYDPLNYFIENYLNFGEIIKNIF